MYVYARERFLRRKKERGFLFIGCAINHFSLILISAHRARLINALIASERRFRKGPFVLWSRSVFFFFHISPVCTCFGMYFREGLYLYSARYTNFYEIREVMVVNRALINSKVKCEPEKIT